MSVYGNNILITFNMLVDTDLGLLCLIKSKYNDPTVFDNNILNYNDNILRGLLQLNESINPLNIIMIDKYKEQADQFYSEFMEVEHEKLIKSSPTTTMVEVVKRFIDSGSMKVTILCSDKLEYERMNDIMSDCATASYSIITEKDYTSVDISSYDTIFIKYAKDLLGFNNTIGKNLIISDYVVNLDSEMYKEKQKIPKKEYLVIYAPNNEFYTVALYHYDESYYLD